MQLIFLQLLSASNISLSQNLKFSSESGSFWQSQKTVKATGSIDVRPHVPQQSTHLIPNQAMLVIWNSNYCHIVELPEKEFILGFVNCQTKFDYCNCFFVVFVAGRSLDLIQCY